MQVGYEKIAIFDHHLALSLKRYKIGQSYNGRLIGIRTGSIQCAIFNDLQRP